MIITFVIIYCWESYLKALLEINEREFDMTNIGINYITKSLLAFLTAVSFIAWLGGTFFKTINPEIGTEIATIGLSVFVVCFAIWLVFILFTLLRNAASIAGR